MADSIMEEAENFNESQQNFAQDDLSTGSQEHNTDVLLTDVTIDTLTARDNPTPSAVEVVTELPTVPVTRESWEATRDIDSWNVLDRPSRVRDAMGPSGTVSVYRYPQR